MFGEGFADNALAENPANRNTVNKNILILCPGFLLLLCMFSSLVGAPVTEIIFLSHTIYLGASLSMEDSKNIFGMFFYHY